MAAPFRKTAYCYGAQVSKEDRDALADKVGTKRQKGTIEDELNQEKLRRILLHCDTRMKALVLLLLSSGIRVSLTTPRKSHAVRNVLVLLMLAVAMVAGILTYSYLTSPSYACGNNQLILQSHTTGTGQVFTTWYNCGDSLVTFNVSGKVWSQSSGQTNYISTDGRITVGPHQSTSVQSAFDTYHLDQISLVEIYAVNAYSSAQVFSPVYDFST